MKNYLIPSPKSVVLNDGNFLIRAGGEVVVFDECARQAADVLANRIKMRVFSCEESAKTCIRLNIVKELDFARNLRAELQVEAYHLEVKQGGIVLSALTAEGLLRGAATLLQLAQKMKNGWRLPCAVIKDWPNFRYRCSADWLVNVECNRWAYDWGDGRVAFLERIKRKLDFCFEHKINMVWFDGFGWDANRFPGYAVLMRECNRYARRLGIKLVFGGYGGGYGTAYQSGEIYRCGYFGKVHLNRRPYPDGKKYACRGWSDSNGTSRFYGTCLSNEKLREAKINEMKKFVSAVNPGVMYIHDIDAGTWLQTVETWKNRCPECRRRWPNDDLAAADGHAGAFASWFRQVRRELSALPGVGEYLPARDLAVAFVSPLYTEHTESKPENVWENEKRYYQELSRLVGPEPGIMFGFREMFFDSRNRKKMADLRRMIDRNGNGHGLLVAAFAGGDNYYSDDPVNISGALAHFYDGASAVYISNVGVHQEPVQIMNAEFLWNNCAAGYRENPRNAIEAEKTLEQIKKGARKPPQLFASGGYFDRLCSRLWGEKAGLLMSRAMQARYDGQWPVQHVWWSITKSLPGLKVNPDSPAYSISNVYEDRKNAAKIALKYARQAAKISDNDDIRWFVSCLEIGSLFADALDLLLRMRLNNDKTAEWRLARLLFRLQKRMDKMKLRKTDLLGGDPGCWPETITAIKNLAGLFQKQNEKDLIFSDFIRKWRVSGVMQADSSLLKLVCPANRRKLQLSPHVFSDAFCDIHEKNIVFSEPDKCVCFFAKFHCAEFMELEFRLGYDGPVKVWLDRRQVFHDAHGTNPGRVDKAIIPWSATQGIHELMIALGSNCGKACGIFARFRRVDQPRRICVPALLWKSH